MEQSTSPLDQPQLRSIKSLAPYPSDAVKAMLDGLRNLPNETFKIDMNTFGRVNGFSGICYGCAATCTLLRLAGKPPYPTRNDAEGTPHRSKYLGIEIVTRPADEDDSTHFADFELAIDRFRKGHPEDLLVYYDITVEVYHLYPALGEGAWYMTTDNWEQELPKVERYYHYLLSIGL